MKSSWISRLLYGGVKRRQAHIHSREDVLKWLRSIVFDDLKKSGWKVEGKRAWLTIGPAVLVSEFHLVQKHDQRGARLPENAVMVDCGIYFVDIPDFLNPPELKHPWSPAACLIRHSVRREESRGKRCVVDYWFSEDAKSMQTLLGLILTDLYDRMVPLLARLSNSDELLKFMDTAVESMDGLSNLWGFGRPGSEGRDAVRAFVLIRNGDFDQAQRVLLRLQSWWQGVREPKPEAFGCALEHGLSLCSGQASK